MNSNLTDALSTYVARFRAGDVFNDGEVERLGALWAALNIREGTGTFGDDSSGFRGDGSVSSFKSNARG